MPLLTILTRTFGGRPVGMAANVASIERQKDRGEIQHLLVVDDQPGGRGIGWSHLNLKNVKDIQGDYVVMLDDDDYLLGESLITGLKRQVRDAPEVVICKMDMGNGVILPEDYLWGKEPVHSHMPCTSYIVRRDIWYEHVSDFTVNYDGDFDFIHSVWKHGHPFHWWDYVASRVGQVSHGKSED